MGEGEDKNANMLKSFTIKQFKVDRKTFVIISINSLCVLVEM